MLIFARTLDRHASRPLNCRTIKVAQRPGCWLSGSVKATKQVAVCILKFLSFKRHTCSHLFLTRLVICLYSTPSGDLWFLSKKKNQRKAHGLCYKVAWESTASDCKRTNNSSLHVHVLEKPVSSKFHFFTDKEVMMKTMLFWKWFHRWLLWGWRQLLFKNRNVQETVS